ncbi:MAG: hypothetical protein ACOY3K_08120 [Candidatus Omnitrophota bacterium]
MKISNESRTSQKKTKNLPEKIFQTAAKSASILLSVLLCFNPVMTVFPGLASADLLPPDEIPQAPEIAVNAYTPPPEENIPSGTPIDPPALQGLEAGDDELPPLPEGWTLAASNENYALQRAYNGSFGALNLMDLRTGQVVQITSVYSGGAYSSYIDSYYDVLSDGSAVIYGKSASIYGNMTYMKRVDGTGETPVNGKLLSVEYDATNPIVKLELDNTTGIYNDNKTYRVVWIDTQTFASAAPEVPAGWTRTPYDEGLAYRQADGRVEVMDLATGAITDRPTSQNFEYDYDSYRRGVQYAITSEGLKEVYITRSNSNTSISVYEPAKRTWFANYLAMGYEDLAVSPDGAYVVIAHNLNTLTIGTLTGQAKTTSLAIPRASGRGIPTVGGIAFTAARTATIRVTDGSGRWLKLTIDSAGKGKLSTLSGGMQWITKPDPTLGTDNVSQVPGIRVLNGIGSASGSSNALVTALSPSQYRLIYNVSGGTRLWSVGYSSFDDYGTSAIETADLSDLASITVGLRLAKGTGTVKFQIELADGTKIAVSLQSVTTVEKFYEIDLAMIRQLYDLSQVKGLALIVENAKVSVKSSSLEVRFGYQPYTAQVTEDPSLDEADVSQIEGITNLIAIDSSADQEIASITQSSRSVYQMDYAIPNGGGWVLGYSAFDDFSTSGTVETADLSALDKLILGIRSQDSRGSVPVIVQIEDDQNRRARVILTGAGSVEKFYAIDRNAFLDNNHAIDLTHIKGIAVILESAMQAGSGELQVRLGGHPYAAPLDPAPLRSEEIAALESTQGGALNAIHPLEADAEVLGIDGGGVKIVYDTGNAGWAGGGLNFDRVDTSEVESIDLSHAERLVFKVRGSVPDMSLKIELTDADGHQAVVKLNHVTDAEVQYWVVESSALTLIDLSRVSTIFAVVEGMNQVGELIFFPLTL